MEMALKSTWMGSQSRASTRSGLHRNTVYMRGCSSAGDGLDGDSAHQALRSRRTPIKRGRCHVGNGGNGGGGKGANGHSNSGGGMIEGLVRRVVGISE